MSTQTTIAIENQSGMIESITVDYDGYLEHTGYILQDNHNDVENVCELIKLGNLNTIAPIIEPSPFIKIFGFNNDSPAYKELSPQMQTAVFNSERDHCIALFRDYAYYLPASKQKKIFGKTLTMPEKETFFKEKDFFKSAHDAWSSYIYLFKNGQWYVEYTPDSDDEEQEAVFEPLSKALAKIEKD